ncbi:MAG TPA: serpin family protein [Anaerolineales bacterium]
MKSILEALSALGALGILLAACAPIPSAGMARSSLKRVEDPTVPSSDETTLVEGNNAFAVDLYRALHTSNGNLAFSPYSLSVALAMPYAGARGNTEAQMAQALHYTLPQDRLHPAFNRLDLDLTKEAQPASVPEQPLQLKIANAVWAEKTFSFLQSYLDLIAQSYGAGVQLADFAHQADAERLQINDWVSQQTNDKIKDLIPPGAVDGATKLVLVNALYFKADWKLPFDPKDTHDAPFNLLDGTQVTTRQMSGQRFSIPYASGDGYQAVELTYAGTTAAMDLIVPDRGKFQEFEASLDSQRLDSILASMQPATLEVALPKFTFRSSFDLGAKLHDLGITDALDPNHADFSGMTGQPNLYITKVLHQAYVAVDEKGTEAAAASAVIMGPTSAMLPPEKLIIDRPFLFLIRDLKSGQILFLGRVLDPSK